MAPLDDMSAPGTATYNSDTMVVGDGTWDFTKNDFLLPNLVGLNLETTQYNGMANRFSTLPQYHSLIKAHGVIGAIVFLFIIPAAVFYARFYTRRPGYAIRYHAYLQILAVLLTTVVFVLGWFAVGPERSLTNPHHGIGVAIYTLILVQIFGGWIIKNIKGRSIRVKLHQWFGRTVALLGIAQVPLGLALYGSPRYLFILYALWMSFLLFMYFIFDYRAWDRPDYVIRDHDGRSEVTRTERTERTEYTDRQSSGARWVGPAAAAGGLWALMRGRKRETSKSRDRSHSRSRNSRIRSRSRGPEVIPSRRESYLDEEKHADRRSERPQKSSGGGFKDKVLGIGAGLGAGALLARMAGKKNRQEDEEYSAVEIDSPNRRRHSRASRRHGGTVVTDYSDDEDYRRDGRRSPLLPGPGGPSAMAAAMSAAERRASVSRPARPSTPQRSHRRGDSRIESTLDSDYSSWVSPSRRGSDSRHDKTAVEKGLLAGLGLGWFAKKMKDRRDSKKDDHISEEEQERLRIVEEERRAGQHEPRYTGDGYSHNTPPRRHSRRESLRPAAPIRPGTDASHLTEESSLIETRPLSGYDAPRPDLSAGNHQLYQPPPQGPVPPTVAQYTTHGPVAPTPPPSVPFPAGNASLRQDHSRHSFVEPAVMPVIPDDPQGILARESESSSYASRRDRRSESRRRAGEAAMAAAASSAGMLAAEQEAQRRVEEERIASRGRTPPVSVKVKVHDDKDRNVTLRRLTEEEAMTARRARRRRADSVSSMSGSDVASGSRSRYRRDTSRRRAAEQAGEGRVEPLSPPQPAFAGGKKPKDSAYYSGPPPMPGPSGTQPGAGATVSSLASPGSHGTWSGMSPIGTPGLPGPSEAASATASAADRRRRRRLERRNDGPAGSGTVDFT